jgi:casein kinase II subunit alpha
MSTGMRVVLKALKPLAKRKIKREIFVIKKLEGIKNVVGLVDVVRDSVSHTISLVGIFY